MAEQLLIRFKGICGHIDLPKSNGAKWKRTVLVRHQDANGPIEPHLPYIECFVRDLQAVPSTAPAISYTRPGVEGRLARVDLKVGTEIRLKGIKPGAVVESIGYQRDVPRMSEVLEPVTIAKSLLKDVKSVDFKRVTAVFDMPAGILAAGEQEAEPTRFPEGVGFKERRLARWTDLYLEYEPPLIVELAAVGNGGAVEEVVFKDSLRMLTIGNEPERLILGILGLQATANGHHHTNGNGEPIEATGHYSMYYNLLEEPPARAERVVPIPSQFDSSGCPNNNYP